MKGHDAPGKRAFEMEFGRIAAGIVVSDDDPGIQEVSHAISRARQAADQGDYIGAIRILGDVKISISSDFTPAIGSGVKPEDVEQALGDLRRALAQAGQFPRREEVSVLCKEARAAASEGRWQAAWALIDEADQRLAESGQAKRSP